MLKKAIRILLGTMLILWGLEGPMLGLIGHRHCKCDRYQENNIPQINI